MEIFFRIFRNFVWITLCLAFYCNSLPVIAQNNKFIFDHITVSDGLSQSTVFSILEDRYGFMWFGTRTGGLNRYDGYSFTIYKFDEENPLSISGNEILALFEDSKGSIWAGTRNDGLNRFNYETNSFYRYINDENDSTSLMDNTINCFCEYLDGALWIGTNSGLCKYVRETDKFIRYNKNKNLNAEDIKALCCVNDSLLWAGGKFGLYLYDSKNNIQLAHFVHDKNNPSSLSDTYIQAIIRDKKGRLWVGTRNGGLNRLDSPEKGEFIRYMNDPFDETSISSNVVRTLHEDKKGVIWIGTKIALEQLSPEQQESAEPNFIHHISDESDERSISQNSVFSFFEDSVGNFWIGSFSGGINYLYTGYKKFEQFKNQYLDPTSLNENIVSSFAENEHGIWVGTEGGGLNLFNRKTGKFKHFLNDINNPNSLTNNFVKALYVDKDNDLWIGTLNGVDFYDLKQNKFIHYLKGFEVYSIDGGNGDEIWFGTTNKLYRLDKTNTKFRTYENSSNDTTSLSSNFINKVLCDKRGEIWIGTKNGLNFFDRENDNFIVYRHIPQDRNSLSHSIVTSICEDKIGRMWTGTVNGLNMFDKKNNRFINYSIKQGLPDDVISNIFCDGIGSLWITTNKGLSKFTPNFYSGQNKNEEVAYIPVIRNFNINDGLLENEFKMNSSFKSKSGEFYIGCANGFNIFHPDNIQENKNIPRVYITELKLSNKPVIPGADNSPLAKPIWQTTELTLNHKQSVITFDFVALNYTSPENNMFAYMMEGFDPSDDRWIYIGNKREVTYTNLHAGTYFFRVKASNNDGVWNEIGTSIKLIILPPWWETLWFRITIIIAVFISILSVYFYKLSSLKKQKRILEEKVKERTIELQKTNVNLEESHYEIFQQKEAIIKQNRLLKEQNDKIESQTKELQIQKKSLEEMNASKDKFFSILAHDLKNPFNSMLGFLDLLKSNYKGFGEEEKYQMIGIAYDSALLIFNLMENLLHWSRSQRGLMPFEPELLNLRLLIETELSLVKNMISKKEIDLELFYGKKETEIMADKNMLGMVIRNLVSNAIKFTPQGGQIKIRITDENNATLFEIADTGIGIPENVIGKLFRLDLNFTREGTANERGTGLGLILCQEFIKAHQGEIWAKSKEGSGSIFYFTIINQ